MKLLRVSVYAAGCAACLVAALALISSPSSIAAETDKEVQAHRVVLDLYPLNPVDPLMALLEQSRSPDPAERAPARQGATSSPGQSAKRRITSRCIVRRRPKLPGPMPMYSIRLGYCVPDMDVAASSAAANTQETVPGE